MKDKNYEELEKVLLDQIEKLNDDTTFKDTEEAKLAIEKSRSISDMTDAIVSLRRAKMDEQRLKLDIVKVAMTAEGYGYSNYLGIEEPKQRGRL